VAESPARWQSRANRARPVTALSSSLVQDDDVFVVDV
jgi:hypothetical protein